MSQPAVTPPPRENRLTRFRGMMSRLDAAGDPARAIERALYVTFPGGAGEKIAASLALRPGSTHLLVGGVGSGKTTELLQVRAHLSEYDDMKAIYLDVSVRHDIAKMAAGVVVVQAGLALAPLVDALNRRRRVPSEPANKAAQALQRLADGYHFDPDYDPSDSYYDQYEFRPGVLVPPDQVTGVAAEARSHVEALLEVPNEAGTRLVVLIDGLDRLSDIDKFRQVVEQDVKVLGSLGLGVVLVAPLKCLYGAERTITESFDALHYQLWRDPRKDPSAQQFLTQVLRRRLTTDELNESALGLLVERSGGVLRDLIALAQLACEAAYIDGAEVVAGQHVAAAADAFGRKHVIGLQADEIEVLQRVRKQGSFVQTSEKDIALLMTRRVLEYATSGAPRYAVHPTIEPLLREMAGERL